MPTMMTPPSRRTALIEINIKWLRQALRLVTQIDATAYSTVPSGFAPHRAGAHLRHVLEFYSCFFEGLDSSHIDYDSRKRDESIESSPHRAAETIRTIVRKLETDPQLRTERIIWVRMEDAEGSGIRDCFMESSISRELQALSSHTVHHFALIAMTLRMQGLDMDAAFGTAPSTRRYQASKSAEAA